MARRKRGEIQERRRVADHRPLVDESHLNGTGRALGASNGGLQCPDCGAARLARTICDAIGQVGGVGLHAPLKVEVALCERCDYAEFTGSWSIVHEDDVGTALGLSCSPRDPRRVGLFRAFRFGRSDDRSR
jgi:hypothetical protein